MRAVVALDPVHHHHPFQRPSHAPADEYYEIVESGSLPLLDMSRSVRSVLLHGKAAASWDFFITRWKTQIIAAYFCSLPFCWAVLFLRAPISRVFSIALALPACLGGVVHISLLRYDVVCLLLKTYEFWFLSTSNLVSMALLIVYLRDARAVIAVVCWIGFQTNLLTDANISVQKVYVRATIGAVSFTCLLMAILALGMLDETSDFVLISINSKRSVRVLLLGLSTQAIMMCRNAYRRRAAIQRRQSLHSASIECVTYRTRVKLQACAQGPSVQFTRAPPPLMHTPPDAMRRMSPLVQMKLRRVATRFPADDVFFPWACRLLFGQSPAMQHRTRQCFACFAYVGLTLPLIAMGLVTQHATQLKLQWVALSCTAFFTTGVTILYQRKLFRQLVGSFDFAFMSAHLTIIHLCLGDLFGWDARSVPLLTYWLWLQWVLTCDVMTPAMRRQLGIRYRLPALIMLLFLIAQVLVVVRVVGDEERPNRSLLRVTIHGHVFELKVVSLLLGRIVVTFGWSCRIVWRLWTMKDDELLMIQGTVIYVTNRKVEKKETSRLVASSMGSSQRHPPEPQ